MESHFQRQQVLSEIVPLQKTIHHKNQQLADPALSSSVMTPEEDLSKPNQPPKLVSQPPQSSYTPLAKSFYCFQSKVRNKNCQMNIQLVQYIEKQNELKNTQVFRQFNQNRNQDILNNASPQFQSQVNQNQQTGKLVQKRTISKKICKKRKKQNRSQSDDQQQKQAPQSFKFPFENEYFSKHMQQYFNTLQTFDKTKETLNKTFSDSYLNCDVRYFNWKLFTEQVGKFDVVIIDPPWRIKGAQQNDSQFMFYNCKFSLEYNTMANSQIQRIPIHLLSDQGFIFLWILNSQLDASLEIMEEWGYELVEEIVWVKLKNEKLVLTQGYYFMHSYEVCLVGYKCKKDKQNNKQLKLRSGISFNSIFAQVRQKSQKPEDLYYLIDMMFKGGKKVQIFARNHNLRLGIFSIGNELGQSYDKWLLNLSCDQCGEAIPSGQKRFKSKVKPNYDICSKCIQSKKKEQFFELANNLNENLKHEYIACNHCKIQPIAGIRFQCNTCLDFDLCESCFDKNLRPEHNFHPVDHQIGLLQVPLYGNGFNVHEVKCVSCYKNPIIGIYFKCHKCNNFNLCQKCYFERPINSFSNLMKRHKSDHPLEAIFQSKCQKDKRYECFSCTESIQEDCWMCQNCHNFFFCQKCYQQRQTFKSFFANTHKKFHVLTKIF